MDKKENEFPQQEAPLKNTDDAFVEVSKDGSPAFPPPEGGQKEESEEDLRKADGLQHR